MSSRESRYWPPRVGHKGGPQTLGVWGANPNKYKIFNNFPMGVGPIHVQGVGPTLNGLQNAKCGIFGWNGPMGLPNRGATWSFGVQPSAMRCHCLGTSTLHCLVDGPRVWQCQLIYLDQNVPKMWQEWVPNVATCIQTVITQWQLNQIECNKVLLAPNWYAHLMQLLASCKRWVACKIH